MDFRRETVYTCFVCRIRFACPSHHHLCLLHFTNLRMVDKLWYPHVHVCYEVLYLVISPLILNLPLTSSLVIPDIFLSNLFSDIVLYVISSYSEPMVSFLQSINTEVTEGSPVHGYIPQLPRALALSHRNYAQFTTFVFSPLAVLFAQMWVVISLANDISFRMLVIIGGGWWWGIRQ